MTTRRLTDRLVGITGPYTKRPSGRFDEDGLPVLRKCSPYWVVRYMSGENGTILQDARRDSLEAARVFAAQFPAEVSR